MVKGEGVYGKLKFELVLIVFNVFQKQKLKVSVHTSTATVLVPEEEVDVEINKSGI